MGLLSIVLFLVAPVLSLGMLLERLRSLVLHLVLVLVLVRVLVQLP